MKIYLLCENIHMYFSISVLFLRMNFTNIKTKRTSLKIGEIYLYAVEKPVVDSVVFKLFNLIISWKLINYWLRLSLKFILNAKSKQ